MKINKRTSPDSKNNVRNIESGLESAFTLVELIVVITILAILGTIAFISLQGYSRDARDSTRTADINNIKTSLELFNVKTGKYPKPDSFSTVTYSGSEIVWYQGILGDGVTTNLKSLNEKPLDPITNSPYIYSTTNSFKEYEVLALYEGNVAYNPIINQTNAATTSLTPKIDGNYNGVFVKTTNYIIPLPSIITSETITPGSGTPLTTSIAKSLVTTNGTNIPKTAISQISTGTLSNFNLLVYTGSITKNSTKVEKINLIRIIQKAYETSILANNNTYYSILNKSSSADMINLVNNIFLSKENLPIVLYKTVLDCGTVTGKIIYGTVDGGSGTLSCPDDIIVCNGTSGSGYTISACNVGTNIVGTGTASYGGIYQWGNNYDSRGLQFINGLVYSPTSPAQITSISNYSTYSSSTFIKGFFDWTTLDSNGVLRSASWNSCATGYHIPTNTEWIGIHTAGLWGTNGRNMSNILKMPMAGYRYWSIANLYHQGSYGHYWSSSPNGSYEYSIFISFTYINPSNYDFRAYGFSIRCFKN